MATKYQNSGSRSGNQKQDLLDTYIKKRVDSDRQIDQDPKSKGGGRKFLKAAIIVLVAFFMIRAANNFTFSPAASAISSVFNSGPGEDLLNRMNTLMVEMGYTDLTHDDLRELRSQGVTATYMSNIRALGFTDLTTDAAVRLANANVTTTFIAMMIELGYDELTLDDFVQLRRAGVTAHYTSNVHDLGYTDVTPE